jgi:uncharacterized heparinase superfamily protein
MVRVAYWAGASHWRARSLEIATEEDSVWDRTAPSKRFAESLHRFDWLADLLAVEDPEAPLMARRLADDWLTRFGKWNWFSWEPHILEGRLWAWMMASETLFSADDENTPKRLKSAVRQTLRLSRCLSLMPQDKARLFAAITLRLAMLTLDLPAGLQARSQAALDAELTAQLLPDGGHASRNPRVAADVLIALVVLDQAADARGVTLSAEVSRAMDRRRPLSVSAVCRAAGCACFMAAMRAIPAPSKRRSSMWAAARGAASMSPRTADTIGCKRAALC